MREQILNYENISPTNADLEENYANGKAGPGPSVFKEVKDKEQANDNEDEIHNMNS